MANITASKEKSLSVANNSNAKYTLLAKFEETKVTENDNTSTIKVTGKISNNVYDFSSTKCTLKVYWFDDNDNKNGKLIASTSLTSLAPNSAKTISGSITVSHTADGTLNGYAKTVWTRSSSNGWCPASNDVSTNNTKLTTTIPIEFNASYEIGDTLTKNLTGVSNKPINNVSKIKITTTSKNLPAGAKYFYKYSDENVTTTESTYTFNTPYKKGNRQFSCGIKLNDLPLVESMFVGYQESSFINYQKPYFDNESFKRTDSTSTTVKVKFTGHIWYGNFGAVQNNQVTINLKYKKGTDTTYKVITETKNLTSSTFIYEKDIANIETTTDLYIIIEIKDKASINEVTKPFVVPKAKSCLDIGSDFINVSGDMLQKGINILEYESGETFEAEYVAGGFMTSAKTKVSWSLQLPKKITNVNVTIVSSDIIARCDNSYCIGNSSTGSTEKPKVTKTGDYTLFFDYTTTEAMTGTNNSAVGIKHKVNLSFN